MSLGLLHYRNDALIDWVDPVNWLHPLSRGLVSWWLAIPGAMGGATWLDLCRRNNGTLTNMDPATDWSGPRGRPGGLGALSFGGGGTEAVNLGGVGNEAITEWTVSAWATRGNDTAGPNIIYEQGGATNGLALYYRSTPNTLHFATTQSSTTVELDATSTFAENSDWFHICGVYDNGSMTLYINGRSEATGSNGTSIPAPSDTAAIGNGLNTVPGGLATADPWDGLIDGVRAQRAALTDAGVAELFLLESIGYPGLLNRVPRRRRAEQEAAAGGTILPLLNHYQMG